MRLAEALSIAHELLGELRQDIADGIFGEEEPLQVLVEDNIVIDYYYSDEVERRNLLHEPYYDETVEEIQIRKDGWLQYKKDKPFLQPVTVKQLIDMLSSFIEYYSPRQRGGTK